MYVSILPCFLASKYNTLVNILVYLSLNLCVRISPAWKFKEGLLEYREYVFLSLLDPAKCFLYGDFTNLYPLLVEYESC